MTVENIREYYEHKKERRKHKNINKRHATGKEVLMIFEMVLKDKKASQIINELKRNDPHNVTNKKQVTKIMTGNCKVFPSELSEAEYQQYIELRKSVYLFWKSKKEGNQ